VRSIGAKKLENGKRQLTLDRNESDEEKIVTIKPEQNGAKTCSNLNMKPASKVGLTYLATKFQLYSVYSSY
jgi:hypothetical protein